MIERQRKLNDTITKLQILLRLRENVAHFDQTILRHHDLEILPLDASLDDVCE